MINFWKMAYEAVKEQRDQFKAENEKLKEEVEHLKEIIRDEEEISEEVGIPQLLVKKSIRRIKMNEKLKEKTMNELIKSVEQWSMDKNLDQGNSFSQFAKSAEELGEVASALCRNDKDSLRDGIGDVVVTLIILAQQNGMDLHECLNTAYDEIKGRTGVTTEDGRFIKESDL